MTTKTASGTYLQVSTRRMSMPENCRLELADDGTVTLLLRDGMLPRRTVCELGALMMAVRVTVADDGGLQSRG